MLHNFPDTEPDTKCVWCGVTVGSALKKFDRKMSAFSLTATIVLFSIAIIVQF